MSAYHIAMANLKTMTAWLEENQGPPMFPGSLWHRLPEEEPTRTIWKRMVLDAMELAERLGVFEE